MVQKLRTVFLFVLLATVMADSARAELRLTEILSAPASDWDGDGAVDSKLDEWVEIMNTGLVPVDLQDHYLRDGTGTAWHYGFSGSLLPGATLLVTGAASVQWQADNAAGTSGLSLNNSGDLVELVRAGVDGIETLVDAVNVPSHAAQSDRALAWHLPTSAWILHDGINTYGGELVPAGTGCAPSPGEVNTCTSAVPLEESTVGRLKAVWEN
jgi:hypothetical protein